MRKRLLAAALLAAPAIARAQAPSSVTSTYAVHGCGTGIVSYTPTDAPGIAYPQYGTVACIDGTALLGNFGLSGTPAVRFDFTTTVAPGVRLLGNNDVGFQYTYTGPACTIGAVCSGLSGPGVPTFVSGRVYALNFLPPGLTDASFIRLTSAYASYEHVAPNAPAGHDDFVITIAVTQTPEPATLALTLGGLAMLGAGASRRRRAA